MKINYSTRNKVWLLISICLALATIAILGFLPPVSVSAGSGAWTPTGGPIADGGRANAIVVHPTIPTTLYATVGIPGNGNGAMTKVYKSTNSANSWSPVYTGTNQLNALAVTGTLVYAVGGQNYGDNIIVKSGDSGATWTAVFTGTNQNTGSNFWATAINPITTTTVYAAGEEWSGPTRSSVVYRSGDDGATWQQVLNVPQGCCGARFQAMAIHPITTTTVYVAGYAISGSTFYGVIYKTTNDGANWSQVYSTTAVSQFTSLAVDASTAPATLYAAAGNGPVAVYRGADDGTGWSQMTNQAGFVLALDLPNNTIFAAQKNSVLTSTLSGGAWTKIGGAPDGIQSLAIDLTSTPRILYAGLYQQGIAKSSDGGVTWTSKNTGIQSPIAPISIVIDPQNPNKLFAAGEYPGGYRSTDGGATWIPLSDVPYLDSFAINPSNTNIVFAGGANNRNSTILKSTDGGLNWTGVYTAPFILPNGSGGNENIFATAIDPVVTATVYAAGYANVGYSNEQGVLLKSSDGGLNWTTLMTTTTKWPGFSALVVNPISNTTVYAGGNDCFGGPCVGAIYRSTNAGVGWTRLFTTTGGTIRSIVIDYQKPNVLYTSDDSYNIYKSTNGGDTWVKIWDKTGRPSGGWLAIDPHVPSHIYLAGSGYMAESVDGGLTFSPWSGTLNAGMPSMDPQTLSVDNGSVTQNLYAGLSGVWKYTRTAPAPGATMTVTVPTSPPPSWSGNPVTITAMLVDQYQNWVADGTAVTFFSDLGTFQGGTSSANKLGPRVMTNKTTTNGVASAVLKAPQGTANVVIMSNGKAVTLTVQFMNANLYLPLIVR